MILHYLSMPVQFERYKSKQSKKYDKEFCGVYVNCHKHYFDRTKEELDKNIDNFIDNLIVQVHIDSPDFDPCKLLTILHRNTGAYKLEEAFTTLEENNF